MNFKIIPFILVSLLLANSTGHLYAQIADSLRINGDSTHANINYSSSFDSLHSNVTGVADTLKHTALVIGDSLRHSDSARTGSIAPVLGYVINGRVEDQHTGEGIPFATIFFPHSPVGTPTDLNGNFVLKLDKLPNDTLRIQAMGYKTVNRVLKRSQHDDNFIVELQRSEAQLNEVVVHAEGIDPALLLLRHIISKKPENNPDKEDNYKYEAYNRLELDLDRMSKSQFEKYPILKSYSFIYENLDSTKEGRPYLPIYLTETISDYYFQREPKKQREFIKGSMVRGVKNQNASKYLGSLYQNVNVYRNFIPVFDKKFVSPISNEGAFYYKYSIKDTERAYGHNIILVQFSPRRPGENCLTGDFWVVDTVYALQRISMDLPKLANINWVDQVSLYQEFAPVNDTNWFCIKDKFIASFSAYGSQKIPGVIGRKTTTYHNIVINDTSVTRVLNDKKWKEEVIIPDSAKNKSDAWWATARPDSLTKSEKRIYKMVDTINQMPVTNFYKNLIKFLIIGTIDVGPVQFGPYFYLYSTNSVEGNRFRFSMGTPQKLKNEHFTGYVAYGDKDKQFKYGFTGLWLLDRKPRMYLYGSYIHDIDQTTRYYDQLGNDNIFSSLFRKPGIPWKLAFTDEKRMEFFKEYYSGFSHKLSLMHREYSPYAPLPSVGIFTDDNGNPSGKVINTEAELELRYAYKEKYLEGQYLRVNLGSKYPVVDLRIAAGLKNILNSGYNYQRARLAVSEDINIPPLGHLYYNVFAGKYFGTLPYPLLEIHPGNEYYYYNVYAFEMMNNYEFISDQYAGFNIEHTIGGGIFNYIPVLKKLKLRQFWTAKGVVGSLSDANQQLNLNKGFPFRTLQGNPYVELGTGISNIFQIFRIDFDWRVTPAPLPTESKSKYFGIFGSVQFAF